MQTVVIWDRVFGEVQGVLVSKESKWFYSLEEGVYGYDGYTHHATRYWLEGDKVYRSVYSDRVCEEQGRSSYEHHSVCTVGEAVAVPLGDGVLGPKWVAVGEDKL